MATARLQVRLTPRGGRDAVDGVRDGLLLVRVASPPLEGAANASLVRLLASELGVPRAAVRLIAGATGRRKIVEVDADGAREAIRRRWPDLGA